MTVTTSTNKRTFTGDGATTAFAYNFKILATTDLKVYTRLIASPYTETLQTEGTDYSVSGAGDAGGGTVTMTSAPADTLQLIILRAVPQTQLTDYTANDAFPAETHEEALDRLAMIVQDQQETLDRSLKVSKTVTDLTTPEFKDPAAARAGKFLAFDDDGDELTVTDGPLADASITSVADAHVLIYDNSDSRWENKAVSGDIAITAAGVASIASGVVVNADINASAAIADSKLATISTADKVSGAAVQVDGATDGTSITIADTDKFLIDDGGTTKYVNASQVNSYTSASVAADDIATGDAAASFQTSSGAVVVDSQASTTTIDGHTGVTVQSSNSGDILLDSAADVVLDAAGNDITLKAGGTTFGALTNSSSDLVIESKVADKDILFKGTDDSSAVTALTLDMSAAGEASFNAGVKIADDMKLSFGAGPDLTIEYDEDGTDTTRVVAANGLSLAPHGTSSGNTTELRFMELAAGGNNYVGFKAPDACSDSVYTLPAAFPASNKILQSTDAGVLTWETAASGGASLSNDANNRVVTADGSGGINGEANLQFDGTNLGIGRSPTADLDVLVADQSAAVLIESSDNTDANLAVGLDLYRSPTGAANDEGMSIDFNMKDAGGNKTRFVQFVPRISTATNGSEDGWLDLRMMVGGSFTTPWRFKATSGEPQLQILDNGSAADPAIENANENFGIYFGNGSMHLSEGGAQAVRWTGTNRKDFHTDVAHGITGQVETDVWNFQQILNDTQGGTRVTGLTEGTQAAIFEAMHTSETTTDTGSSAAALTLRAATKSGTGVTTVGSSANGIVLDMWGATRVVFKGDGTVHAADTSWATALDEHNDVALSRALTKTISQRGFIQSKWDRMVNENAQTLRKAGVIGSINPETGRPDMIAIQPTIMLAYGAIWKLTEEIMAALETMENRDPGFLSDFRKTLKEGADRAPLLLTA